MTLRANGRWFGRLWWYPLWSPAVRVAAAECPVQKQEHFLLNLSTYRKAASIWAHQWYPVLKGFSGADSIECGNKRKGCSCGNGGQERRLEPGRQRGFPVASLNSNYHFFTIKTWLPFGWTGTITWAPTVYIGWMLHRGRDTGEYIYFPKSLEEMTVRNMWQTRFWGNYRAIILWNCSW